MCTSSVLHFLQCKYVDDLLQYIFNSSLLTEDDHTLLLQVINPASLEEEQQGEAVWSYCTIYGAIITAILWSILPVHYAVLIATFTALVTTLYKVYVQQSL